MMLRARITEEEYANIRIRAIHARESTMDFLAAVIRMGLECMDAAEREEQK